MGPGGWGNTAPARQTNHQHDHVAGDRAGQGEPLPQFIISVGGGGGVGGVGGETLGGWSFTNCWGGRMQRPREQCGHWEDWRGSSWHPCKRSTRSQAPDWSSCLPSPMANPAPGWWS